MSLLSAESSPSALVTGVRRANRKPLLIIGGLLFLVFLIIAVVMSDRANRNNGNKQEEPVPEKPAVEATTSTLNDLQRMYGGTGEVEASFAQEEHVNAPESAVGMSTPVQGGSQNTSPELSVPTRPVSSNSQQISNGAGGARQSYSGLDPDYSERLQQLNAKKASLFETGLVSKMAIELPPVPQVKATTLGGEGAQLENLRQQLAADGQTASYEDRLAAVQRIQGATDGGSINERTAPNEQDDSSEIHATTDSTWTLNSRLQRPLTPYVIRTGFVIPGVMLGGVNSDLPGMVRGQVSQTVYDTATGKYPLIPQGSQLIGVYGSNIAFGQDRVQVAWQRVIFPDGRAINISGMPGTDSGGYAGMQDQVDHHFWRVIRAALAMSVISAGYSLSQDNSQADDNERQSASGALSEALGQNMGQTAMQMIQKNLDIQPTIVIRPGLRFNVMINKDIVFDAPYQAFK